MNYTSNAPPAVQCQMKPMRDKQVCFMRGTLPAAVEYEQVAATARPT